MSFREYMIWNFQCIVFPAVRTHSSHKIHRHITLASIALQVTMCVMKTNSVPGRQLEPEQEHTPYCILNPYAYSLVGNIRLIYKISYTYLFKNWIFLYQEESPSFSYIVIFYIWHLTQTIKIEYSSTRLRKLSDNGKDNASLELCLEH